MEKEKLQLLKEKQDDFLALYSNLRRAKNQKQRKAITKDLNWLKSKMIKDFDLMVNDLHVNHYKDDNTYFKNDLESIISKHEEKE